jgi:hypothetical protein
MDVKEAIAAAKSYVRDVYADEALSNLGLEETEYDESFHRWNITIGFSRPWNAPRSPAQVVLDQIGALGAAASLGRRVYKIVTISDQGDVIAMKNREVADAET